MVLRRPPVPAVGAVLRPVRGLAARGGRGRPRLAPVLGILAVVLVALAGSYLWLRDSALVRVERVTIVGAGGPEAARVRSALDEAARTMTTLHVRDGALRNAVRAFPTVRGIRADPRLPHALRIVVLRRPAIGILRAGAQSLAVAADGTLLRDTPLPPDLPALDVAVVPGRSALAVPGPRELVAASAAAPGAMRVHLERMWIGPRGLVAALRGGPVVFLGSAERLRAKWIAAARVLGDPGADGARYIDVTVPDRPVAGGMPQGRPSTTG